MTSRRPIITVATTGPIASKVDNPALPTQPHEIADAVASAFELGAAVAHVHLRDEDDQPTARFDVARKTIGLIGERCPIHVQLSTGVGLGVPFEEREALVELRPAMATLNPCTMNFGSGVFHNAPADVERLARRMRDLGVKPELEIYDSGHLDECLRMLDRGLLDEPLQFSIVLGVRGGMGPTPENLLGLVRRLPPAAVWQVIAVGRRNLELSAIGVALGGNVRAGMEDCLYLRHGELAPSNDTLVRRAVGIVCALALAPADVDDARTILGLF
jgi:uncharacterized protein (DUF849 family)